MVLAILVSARIFTNDHWWRVHRTEITYNDQKVSNTAFYRSPHGDLLVDLRASGDYLYEVHYYKEQARWVVGITNPSNFIVIPGWAYSINVPPPTVDMGGVKIDIDPDLTIGPNSLKFLSAKKAIVVISW